MCKLSSMSKHAFICCAVGPFGLSAAQQRAKWGECLNADDRCQGWADEGECKKNPAYMLVHCRPACGKCDPKAKGKTSQS